MKRLNRPQKFFALLGVCGALMALCGLMTGCLAADASSLPPAETVRAETLRGDTSVETARFSPYSGSGPLIPWDDYGPLIPYAGGKVDPGYLLWGLATLDGRAVTDPVYGEILPYGPFLMLFRGGEFLPDGSRASEQQVTLCARDGSWTRDAGNFHHSFLLEGRGLAAALTDGSVIVLSAEGEVTAEFSRERLTPYLGEDYDWDDPDMDGAEVVYAGGPLAVCRYDEDSIYDNFGRYDCFMDPDTGEISAEPPAGWSPDEGWGDLDESPVFPDYPYPDRLTDLVTGKVYYWGQRQGSDEQDLLDASGNLLLVDFFTPGPGLWEPVIAGGMVGTIENGVFQYVRIDSGETVFSRPLTHS